MRIVTVEEHFLHPGAVARVLALTRARSQTFGLEQDIAEHLAGERLAHMDRVGIDVQVVSHGANGPDTLTHPEAVDLCRRVNDDLAAQIAQHPNRFRGFATIPLYDPPAAADEMRRCVGELGFVGTLVHGTVGGRFLDDERFDPVLAAAEEVNLPIYVHPGVPQPCVQQAYYAGAWPQAVQSVFAMPAFGWHAEAGIHVLRLILSGAFDRHPGLTLLSGHWGEFVGGWLDRIDETTGRTGHLDRPVSEYYRAHVWITPSGLYSQNQLQFFLREVGAHRIVHSEDYPYVVRDNVSAFLEKADITDDERDAIAHGNAEQLLRLTGV